MGIRYDGALYFCQFAKHFDLTDRLREASFLITGATGLIGSSLIRCLLALDVGIKIIAPVRNRNKAEALFDELQKQDIHFIECDFTQYDYGQIGGVNYIIHCAAPTSSKFFVEHPVETFGAIMDGTKKMLDLACQKKVKGIVYLSSMESYGRILDDSTAVTENVQGYIDPTAVRSSYSMGKRAAETLCCLYASQYGVPVKVARLAQSTGAGFAADDNRFIVQFAKKAFYNQDIVLFSTGESALPCCYITDCVSAILYILLRGNAAECYNVANENTYISVKDLAYFVQRNINPKVSVQMCIDATKGYAATTKLRLDTQKLRDLGWLPRYDLSRIFEQLIRYLKSL